MELIKVTDNTYYIKNPTNIGIYKDNNQVYLIDSGNDKEAGKKILKIINEQGWIVKGIINTHSNADHIGGNHLIENRTNCSIYTSPIERCFTENPILEPSFLYGGYPLKDLRNKFLQAENSHTLPISNIKELEYFPLKGHFFDMIGLKTKDNVYFLGDALFSEETINKYHIFFIYNVKEYLNTLEYLSTLKGKLFIASHIEPTNDITELININRNKINEIATKIYNLCEKPLTFEELLQSLFNEYNLTLNINQYVLVGSTIKSYLSYLYDLNKLTYTFIDNKMYWQQKTL